MVRKGGYDFFLESSFSSPLAAIIMRSKTDQFSLNDGCAAQYIVCCDVPTRCCAVMTLESDRRFIAGQVNWERQIAIRPRNLRINFLQVIRSDRLWGKVDNKNSVSLEQNCDDHEKSGRGGAFSMRAIHGFANRRR